MRTFFLRTLTGVAVLWVVCLPALAQTTGTIRGQTVIAVPASDDTTFSAQNVLDLSLNREFQANKATIQVDLQLFNVFNNDAHDSWQTLIVAPGDPYYPRAYVLPRRLGLRLGLRF